MRTALLVIHILAAGTWFGTNIVQLAVNPTINTKGGAIAAHWYRTTLSFVARVYTPAAVVSLVTGVMLLTAVDFTPYEFSDTFVSVGFAMIIFGSAMGMGFFVKQGGAAADAYEAGDSDAAAAIEKKIALGGLLDTVLMIVTFTAMVAKWGV